MTVADKERGRRFDALFETYLADMVAFCGWRAQSAADAQDAVSEVFLAAWRRLDDVPPGNEARLWLYGTARRVLANQARAGRRQALLYVRLSAVDPAGREKLAASEAAGQSHGEAAPPEVEAVRQALGALKPADQEVLLLAEWEGLTPAEIARVLHCPVVTARGRLFRARRRFRTAFEDLDLDLETRGVGTTAKSAALRVGGRQSGSPGGVVSRCESLSRGVVE